MTKKENKKFYYLKICAIGFEEEYIFENTTGRDNLWNALMTNKQRRLFSEIQDSKQKVFTVLPIDFTLNKGEFDSIFDEEFYKTEEVSVATYGFR